MSSSNLPELQSKPKWIFAQPGFGYTCYILLCGDFCDIMSRTWDPNTDISDMYMFETYSLFHTYTTSNNSTLLPTIAFCSRARLLQGSSFKALSKSASQVNSSQEWTAQDVSQPSLLLIKAATKSHHVIRKMHGICLKTLKWRAWALCLEYIGMHHPSSCTCPHSQMIPGFIRFSLLHLLQLVNVHEMPG